MLPEEAVKGRKWCWALREIMTLGLLYLYFVLFSFFLKSLFSLEADSKVLSELVAILLLFHVLFFWLWGMWDLGSLTRDWTHIPCTGRRSLNHWAIREVPGRCFVLSTYLYKQMLLLSHTFGKNSSRKITFLTKLTLEYIVWLSTYG